MAESHEGVACHRKSQKDKNGQQIVLYPNPRSFRLASPPHQTYTPNNEHLVPEMDRLPTTNFSVALLLGTWISTICRLQILSTWIHMYIMYIMYMSCVCFPGSLSLETLRLQLQGHQTWSAPSNQVTNTTTDWHPPRISGWCPRRTLASRKISWQNLWTNLPGPSWSFQSAGRDLHPECLQKTHSKASGHHSHFTTFRPQWKTPRHKNDTKWSNPKGGGKNQVCTVYIYILSIYVYIFSYSSTHTYKFYTVYHITSVLFTEHEL